MGREPESLREVIARWPNLPHHIVRAILAPVRTAGVWRSLHFVVTMSGKHSILNQNRGDIAMPERSTRTAKLDLRLSPAAKQKLQTAAESAGRTVSEFVLESALVRADETLADRTHFGLDAERWKAFMEALDAPPREIPRLGRLLQEPSVFERGD
jgi:uncharacterized protein (DUF1778 family)